MESRRPDVILLAGAAVVVIELKGKITASQADIDQVAAYARDLASYHRECAGRRVIPVVVPTRAVGYQELADGVHIAGPDALDEILADVTQAAPGTVVDRSRFLSDDAYCPLPTLVEAARELFASGELRVIHRARSATDPAVDEISRIIHEAARTKTRHLVLLTGVPGAGKTLVGLRTVHARYLDDLAVARSDGKPTVPAVFLSGNGPLVSVLQYELKNAGGDGKTFVRGVKQYVQRYSRRNNLIPPEHVLVFDEAQRAYDAKMMADKHDGAVVVSEPEQFIEFADRIPEWCVVVGLIGTGQEIHVGEEGGVGQWRVAVERSNRSAEWQIHVSTVLSAEFENDRIPTFTTTKLNLDVELRYHTALDLHSYVDALLRQSSTPADLETRARKLNAGGFHLRITRSLEVAKAYLRDRYVDDRSARFGLIASSKDRDLPAFEVENDFQATKRVKIGPWYGDDEDSYGALSCRHLELCVTEFGSQGLELDASLLAWGSDFRISAGRWSNEFARGYQKKALVKDAFLLRLNAYRVLLTRARDACVVFVPELRVLDETFAYLVACGWTEL